MVTLQFGEFEEYRKELHMWQIIEGLTATKYIVSADPKELTLVITSDDVPEQEPQTFEYDCVLCEEEFETEVPFDADTRIICQDCNFVSHARAGSAHEA